MPSVCGPMAEVVDDPESVASILAEDRRVLRAAVTRVVHDLTGPVERMCAAARDFEEQMARIGGEG